VKKTLNESIKINTNMPDSNQIKKQNIVIVTGGFDPLHKGHIAYMKSSKKLGDKLVVGVNSDEWLTRKKGRPFMSLEDRVSIIKELKFVEDVIIFDDADDSSTHAIWQVRKKYPNDHLIFANGGDRTKDNIPEMVVQLTDNNISFKFGVGGSDKINSSSWILEEWKSPKTIRNWGYYRVLHENGDEVKVKELIVTPGKKLSMQKHQLRSEHWFVAEGTATVNTLNFDLVLNDYHSKSVLLAQLDKFDSLHIKVNQWHQLCNETDQPLKVIEIQYGKNCVESDILRIPFEDL